MRFAIPFVLLLVFPDSCEAFQRGTGLPRPLMPALAVTQDGLGTVPPLEGIVREIAEDSEEPVRRFKKQAIQKIAVSGGVMRSTAGNDLNSSFFEAAIGTGIPLGSFDNILGVTPSVRVDWIDAAPGIDVPSELYEAGVGFFYRKPINERWSAMAIVRPAIRSDLTTSRRALRVFGLGLLTWQAVPEELSLSFGAVALGRADIPVLPALGLQWTPQPEFAFDLRFPQSRLAYRVDKDGAASETWTYLSGGLGGNTWAVTRASGAKDELSLRDLRLMAGIEHIVDGGGGWFAELGYALDRRIEYESTGSEVPLGDALLLQAGWSY